MNWETLSNGHSAVAIARGSGPAAALVERIIEHRAAIDEALLSQGAVLFRGSRVDSETDFESIARTLCDDLYTGNPEHVPVPGSAAVQTPVPYAPNRKLLWHNENSFNTEWPLHIIFCCVLPADRGGETPLVDSRQVLARLDRRIVDRFTEHGIVYVRNYGTGFGLPWQKVFATEDPGQLAERCRAADIEFEWRPNGALHTRYRRPAVLRHPRSGEWSWFNQAQHWHASCLDEETRELLREVLRDQELPRTCYYGDGSQIEDSVMQEILGVYAELELVFPWQPGDVAVLDNVLVAHGRNPYRGKRRLLVAIGDMRRSREERG